MDDHIQGAAVEAHDHGIHIGDDLEGDLLQLGGSAPVVGVSLHDHGILGGIGNEPEGAGAHGGGGLGLAGACGDDGGGHGIEKLQAGLRQTDDDPALLVRGDLLHNRKSREQRCSVTL